MDVEEGGEVGEEERRIMAGQVYAKYERSEEKRREAGH